MTELEWDEERLRRYEEQLWEHIQFFIDLYRASVEGGRPSEDPSSLDRKAAEFRETIRTHPNDAKAFRGLAVVHALRGNRQEALVAMAKAFSLAYEASRRDS